MEIMNLLQMPDLRHQVIELIESSFDYHQDNSFETDFYPLISKNNNANIYCIYDREQDKVLAHTAVKPRVLKGKYADLPVLFLGGICVSPDYRGTGLFKQLFQYICDQYSDIALMMLWSGDPAIYQQFGFRLCIDQYQYGKTNFQTPLQFEKSTYQQLNIDQQKQIQELYQNKIASRFIAPYRSEKDWQEVAAITSAKLFYTECSGTILDYFVMDKGQDLSGIIHESTIQPGDYGFFSLLNHGSLWSPTLTTQIRPAGQYASLVRLHNPEKLSVFLQKEASISIQIKSLPDQRVAITYDGEIFEIHDQDFLLACFGPCSEPIFPNMNKIYIPGVDSI